jgi:hypothetical protein
MPSQFRQHPSTFPNISRFVAEDGLQGFSVQGDDITWVQVR